MHPTVSRSVSQNLVQTSLRREAFQKHLLTMPPSDPSSALFDRLASSAEDLEGTVVRQMVLGGSVRPEVNDLAVERVKWPLTWLRGDPCNGHSPPASQAIVISGAPVRPLRMGGRLVGMVYEDEDALYCQLGGVLPTDANIHRPAQAQEFFENMEAALMLAGMDFRHTVRTWLYLDQLLDWYDAFNEVRTRFFEERGVFDHLVPASTGIGAANRAGTAVIGDALAIKPKTKQIRVFPVASPLQCPAIDYKSSFSRAVEVETPDCRELYVSGTASIAPDGGSMHVGDPEGQIARTMEVASAILASRGMDWADSTRAIAYFKDMKHLEVFRAYCDRIGIRDLPAACLHADVCRDELLFEIEVETAAANTS